MRVLHLDSGREMRGGQYQVLALVERAGEGHTLLSRADSPLMDAARSRGLNVRPLGWAALARESGGTDIVHAHDARTHSMAALVSRAPVVVSRRVAFAIGRSPLSRWKYARASHYLAVSSYVKSTLLDAGIPEDRISVVYDGVDLPWKQSAGGLIVAPAVFDRMKGIDLVEQAAALGGYEVHFSSNLTEDLESASLLVYITRSEGLGSAALLAMAHGVPVVASRVGGLPEIVEDGVTGVLTDNDPEAICAAMARALALRRELGANGRLAVAARFSVAHMVENTLNVYRKVL